MGTSQRRLDKHPRIDPRPIDAQITVTELVDRTFLAYNGARLREACQLFAWHMLEDDVTVGMSLTGALTPAGLGMAAIIPLIEHGFVDWIVSTGANLYHDTHFGLGLSMHIGSPFANDVELRQQGIVRIYDILFDYTVLLETDAFFYKLIAAPEFQKAMERRSSTTASAPMCASASVCSGCSAGRCWRWRTSMACRSTPRRPVTAPSA